VYDPPGSADAISIDGKYAYLADNSRVRVLDISDPTAPTAVGSVLTGDPIKRISIQGHHAYASQWESMSVVDVESPTSPVVVGSFEIFGRPGPARIAGNRLHLAAGFGGFRVFDLADPSTPMEISSFDLVGDVMSVQVQGNKVFLAGGHAEAEQFLKVAPKPDPGKSRYAPASGLLIVDIENRSTPLLTGFCPFGYATDAVVRENRAYVTDWVGGLGVMDVSDPAAPTLVGTTDTPYGAMAVTVEQTWAYVISVDSDLRIIDVSEPTAPEVVSGVSLGTDDVVVQGDYAYVANSYYGLYIIDVSNPQTPIPLPMGTFDPENWVEGLAVEGPYVYIANGIEGVCIVDVSNPNLPFWAGGCDTPGFARSLVMQNGRAFVADQEGGIRIIDCSDPANASEIGHFVTPCPATTVSVQGDCIVAGCEDGGILILQSTLPSAVSDDPAGARIRPAAWLGSSAPNPFQEGTQISFTLAQEGPVSLAVFLADGQQVATVIDDRRPAGPQTVTWSGRDDFGRPLASGTYFCRLRTGGSISYGRMVILR
jgi:hypothetical protein